MYDIYQIKNESDVYSISKLLFLLKYPHEIYINHNNNIFSFDDTKLLVYTKTPIININTECIILSTNIYNNTNIYEKLNNIALQNNIQLNLTNLNEIDSKIIYLITKIKIQTPIYKSYDINLPIFVYQLKKQHIHEDLCKIFMYMFKQTGCHTLAIVFYNILLMQKNQQYTHNNAFNNIKLM